MSKNNKKILQEELKQLQIENQILKKGLNKSVKSSPWEIINSIIGIVGILGSMIALIFSIQSYSFTKDISPLSYSFDVSSKIVSFVSPDKNADISYNVSDIIIELDNQPGEISEIYISNIFNEDIDIHNCEYNDIKTLVLNDDLMLRYKCVKNAKKTTLNIGFSKFEKLTSGYFFIVFKSYSGDYYYNIVHYITSDDTKFDKETNLYNVDCNIDFYKMSDIYDRNKLTELCININKKDYTDTPIDIKEYTSQIEKDYNLLKSKLEG